MHRYKFRLFCLLTLCGGFCFSAIAQKSETEQIVGKIQITGNKVTQSQMILRELTFAVGDTLEFSPASLERSESNLYNLGLFNFVTITTSGTAQHLVIHISVVERWYWWPEPLLENAENNFNSWWEEKDFSRLTGGINLKRQNFRGRRETLILKARVGFTNELSLTYVVPWINKKKTLGLKTSFSGLQQREVNVTSLDNHQVFYEYNNDRMLSKIRATTELSLRSHLYTVHGLELGFHRLTIADSVLAFSPDYTKQQQQTTDLFSLSYHFRHDKRDRVFYPLKGFLLEGLLDKKGVGIFNNNGLNLLDLTLTYHHHFALGKKWFGAYGVEAKTNLLDKPPYYFQKGLGYLSRNIRSYEFYVMDGQAYRLMKTNLKYQLVNKKDKQLPGVRNKQYGRYFYEVYLSAFFDAGFVKDEIYADSNPLSNNIQFGGGLGLDFTSVYDRVVRMEVSMNKFGETGIFLHFTKPI